MSKNTYDKHIVSTTFSTEMLRQIELMVGYYDKPFRTRGDLIRYAVEQLLNEYMEVQESRVVDNIGTSYVDDDGYNVTIDKDGYAIRQRDN